MPRGGAKNPLGAVLEDHEDSESLRKKVKFRARSNHSSPRHTTERRQSLLQPFAIDESGTGEVGLRLLADSNKGGRRYSMDDSGVNIAHRAELHTSEVKCLPFTRGSAVVVWRKNMFGLRILVARTVVVVPVGSPGVLGTAGDASMTSDADDMHASCPPWNTLAGGDRARQRREQNGRGALEPDARAGGSIDMYHHYAPAMVVRSLHC